MSKISKRVAIAATLVGLGACGQSFGVDGSVPVDGGAAPDDGMASDLGGPDGGTDAGADAGVDAGPPDAGGPCGGVTCGVDEACVRDVCLATCGGDLSGWDDALSGELTPLFNLCRGVTPRGAFLADDALEVYDLTSGQEGAVTTFEVSRFVAGPPDPPSPTPVGTATLTDVPEGVLTFAGGFLPVSPDGSRAAFGSSRSDFPFPGELYVMATDDGTLDAEVAGEGIFDAAFRDDDRIVVAAGGLGGTSGVALYQVDLAGASPSVARVGTTLGDANGAVAWSASGFALIGGFTFLGPWADGETGDKVFLVTEEAFDGVFNGRDPVEVGASPSPTGVFELRTPADEALGSSFVHLSNDTLVVTERDELFMLVRLAAYDLTFDPTVGATLDNERDLTTGALFFGVVEAGPDELLLGHADGALRVRRD